MIPLNNLNQYMNTNSLLPGVKQDGPTGLFSKVKNDSWKGDANMYNLLTNHVFDKVSMGSDTKNMIANWLKPKGTETSPRIFKKPLQNVKNNIFGWNQNSTNVFNPFSQNNMGHLGDMFNTSRNTRFLPRNMG